MVYFQTAIMVTNLGNLYKIKKSDIRKASIVLAEAFHNDPAWLQVIPDEDQRLEKLPMIFEFTLLYSLKYGEVYAPSDNLEGVAVWLTHKTADMTVWRIIRSGAYKKGIKIGGEIGKRISLVFRQIEEDRKHQMKGKSYFYLQAIGISPKYQGRGFGGQLLKGMFERADREGIPIYLETETESNAQMYKKYGFKVLKEGQFINLDFYFWELIREPKYNKKTL